MTYPIPTEAFDDRLAVIATSGAGKTYAVLGAMARLAKMKARFIAFDALGVMYGLRLKPDGSPSDFKPVIFGGPHGDLPLLPGAAALIGETAATMSESAIIDLSQLGSKSAERRFMLAFLTALERHNTAEPVHLLFDEADLWAPQRILDKEGDAMKLLGRMDNVVRRGRVKGFIPWLITQRPAVLSKDVLSMADGVVFMKLTGPQDRDAVWGWIEGQADKAKGKEILAILPTLDRGEALIWIPGRQVMKTGKFPENSTFDSSRTPKRGEKRKAVDMKPLDLGKLKDRLAAVEAEAKANDPAALKAQLATANAQIRQLSGEKTTSVPKSGPITPDPRALAAARAEGAQTILDQIPAALDYQHSASFKAGISAGLNYLIDKAKIIAAEPAVLVPIPDRKPLAKGLMPAWKCPAMPTVIVASPAIKGLLAGRDKVDLFKTHSPAGMDAPHGIAKGPQLELLRVLAWWASMGKDQVTRSQACAVAGWRTTSGHIKNVAGYLKTLDVITYPQQGVLELADWVK